MRLRFARPTVSNSAMHAPILSLDRANATGSAIFPSAVDPLLGPGTGVLKSCEIVHVIRNNDA